MPATTVVKPLKTRAALYLRSSKDRSDIAIDAQRRELTQLAADRGLTIVQEYSDVVESAKDDRRPAFQALRTDLKARVRPWDVILLLDPSRLSRNQYVAHVFTHDCRSRGVTVLYAHMPASDPIVEIVVLPLMHAIAELHSHDSRQKGLAGMAENVRQGWRAGGRAPMGYRLEHVATGAVREGEPVRKSRLVPSDDAVRIAGYLRDRAAGTPRSEAARRHGVAMADSSLVGLEWQALTFAGHTVWNVHQERDATGAYRGGHKRRPRAEWVIQRDTHHALITDAEAEAILAKLEAYAPTRSRAGATEYLLTGLLKTPAGQPWHVDGGGKVYRTKGRQVSRTAVDQVVLERVGADLRSTEFVGAMLAATRDAHRSTHAAERDRVQAELEALSTRVSRFLDMAAELASPGPVLRKIDECEKERERLARYAASLEEQDRSAEQLAKVSEADVLQMLEVTTSSLDAMGPVEVRAFLASVVERIELDPSTLTCAIHYRVEVTRDKVASPRGRELVPAIRGVGLASVKARG